MQITSGLYSLLSHPGLYDAVQELVQGPGNRRIVQEYILPVEGLSVLDVGCGTAAVLEMLPPCDYLGVDLSPRYVDRARKRPFAGRARFHAGDVQRFLEDCRETFDLVLAKGLLHHLDDVQAVETSLLIRKRLKPGGRLVTEDPVYVAEQSRLARFFIDRDRGRNVRTLEDYRRLFAGPYKDISLSIRHDLLRIPYTLVLGVMR